MLPATHAFEPSSMTSDISARSTPNDKKWGLGSAKSVTSPSTKNNKSDGDVSLRS